MMRLIVFNIRVSSLQDIVEDEGNDWRKKMNVQSNKTGFTKMTTF